MTQLFDKSEAKSLYQLIQRTIEYSYHNVYPDRAVLFFKNYHSIPAILERSRNGVIFILKRKGSLLATGSLVNNEISGVFVAPECQGCGHGNTIMHELERHAQQKGFSEILLDISLPSRSFYEKLDYQISEECIFDVGMGEHLKYWRGVKKITI